MAAEAIIRGENAIIQRDLKQQDGITDLPLASFSNLIVRLKAGTSTIKAYRYPSDVLRDGDTPSQLELEITEDISSTLPEGTITMEIAGTIVNAAFLVDSGQTDIYREEILVVSK